MEAALNLQPRGFVVEFAGLPGSGKSTLAHALAESLRSGGQPTREPTYDLNHRLKRWRRMASKVIWVLRCAAANPLGSYEAARSIARSEQRSLTDLLNTIFNMLYICELRRAVAKRPGIHILDQGFFQQVWSVRFSASRPVSLGGLERLAGACLGAPAAGAVIFVDVAPETAMRRLVAREGNVSRLEQRLSRERQQVELAAAEKALAEARGAVTGLGGPGGRMQVETLKNEDGEDLEAAATALARQVRAWVSTEASGGAEGASHGS